MVAVAALKRAERLEDMAYCLVRLMLMRLETQKAFSPLSVSGPNVNRIAAVLPGFISSWMAESNEQSGTELGIVLGF
jgi:hypothetical protein